MACCIRTRERARVGERGGAWALTWEMTSLKDDLNSCTSVVNRLTSCPVFLASKKAMSCLAVGHGGSGWGRRGRHDLRMRPRP